MPGTFSSLATIFCEELLGNLDRDGKLLSSASIWIDGVEVVRLAISGFSYLYIIQLLLSAHFAIA